ncbi:glycosyltransferase family 4 protein [bacterium]|nr:glycosyltransferase family 4 protein [bacterium]
MERYAFSLAELLREKGNNVSFFSMKHPENILSDDERYFVEYIDYPTIAEEKGIIRGGVDTLRRTFFFPQAARNISYLLDDKRPDIVHIQSLLHYITPSILYPIKRRGIPVVWTLHDYSLLCANGLFFSERRESICTRCLGRTPLWAIFERCKKNSISASTIAALEMILYKLLSVWDKVDRFICPSRTLMEYYKKGGFPEEKLVYLPNFVDEVSPKDLPREKKIIFSGRLSPEKGIKILLELASRLPEIDFELAGTGQLEKQLLENRLANIHLLGYLTKEELFDRLNRAAVTLFPSIWLENLPYSVLESMMLKTPVVASDVGAAREIVKDNETGVLFSPQRLDEAKEKIITLMNDTSRLEEMGRKARDFVLENFDRETHYQRVMEVYNSV